MAHTIEGFILSKERGFDGGVEMQSHGNRLGIRFLFFIFGGELADEAGYH